MKNTKESPALWVAAFAFLVALALFTPTSELPRPAVAATLEEGAAKEDAVSPDYELRYIVLEDLMWELENGNLCNTTWSHKVGDCQRERIPLKNETYGFMERVVLGPLGEALDEDIEKFFTRVAQYKERYFPEE